MAKGLRGVSLAQSQLKHSQDFDWYVARGAVDAHGAAGPGAAAASAALAAAVAIMHGSSPTRSDSHHYTIAAKHIYSIRCFATRAVRYWKETECLQGVAVTT